MEKKKKNTFTFLSIASTVKSSNLSKTDVIKVKRNLAKKMNTTNLVVGIAVALINITLVLIMGIQSGWNNINVYSVESVIGQVVGISFSFATIIVSLLSIYSENKKRKGILARISSVTLFLAIELQIFLSLVADAKAGFLSSVEAISPSVILVAFLIVTQPAYWLDAVLLNGTTAIGIFSLSIMNTIVYKAQALHYYIFIAIFLPLVAYLVVSILFYAESQKYCEELRNGFLNNAAMYDELTHCKNRYALREFLTENSERWSKQNVSLLLIMFDIDNFKLYNDQFSHPGGDYCLKTIAEAIRKEFRSPSLDFFRYGGEEFLLFFELDNPEEASKYMERVRNAVKSSNIIAPDGAPEDVVTISVGGAVVQTENNFNFEESLKIVDEFLYQAKRSGKNVCVLNGYIVK